MVMDPADYDPFAVFRDAQPEPRKRKVIDPQNFKFADIGAKVSEFPEAEMAKRHVNLQSPEPDPILPNATNYDPFATFRQSRTAVNQPDPSLLFPPQQGAKPAAGEKPNLGVLGESFGIYGPQDQQTWLKSETEAAKNLIADAQARIRNRRAMGMSPDDDLLGGNETAQATTDIKQGQARLKELAAIGRGELPLPIKSGLRSAVENFPRSVGDTILSIPQMAGIIKGYVQGGPVDDDVLLNWSRGAKEWVARQFPGDPARQNEFTQQLATGAGSLVSFYGIGILARLAKLSQAAQIGIVSGFGGAASGSQGFEEATKELLAARAEAVHTGDQPAVDDYDRLLKTIGYTGVGFTEAIPIARTLTRAVPSPTTSLGHRLLQGAEGAAEEAVQEGGAQLAQNLISQQTTDPNRETMTGVGESAAVGGTLGGLLNLLLPGRFTPQGGPSGGQQGGAGGPPPIPQLPPPDGWEWMGESGIEDRGSLTPLEDLPVGDGPPPASPQAPLALPNLNAPERNALKAEMAKLLQANPSLAGQAEQLLAAIDQPGPTQNVVQAALQKVRDTGKLSAVANELIQTMRSGLPQAQTQTPLAPDLEIRDLFSAPGTAGRVQTSPLQQPTTPGQTQTLNREPLTLPSVPLEESDILPALGQAPRELDDLGYYSQALEAAKSLRQERGTPEQMLAMLKSAGVKEAEIQATGLDKLIASKTQPGQNTPPVITRQEIVDHLTQNRVGVKESRYDRGESEIAKFTDRRAALYEQRRQIGPGTQGDVEYQRLTQEIDDLDRAHAKWEREQKTPKWERWSLDPGNPTYRENVVHLDPDGPAQRAYTEATHEMAAKYGERWSGEVLSPEDKARMNALYDAVVDERLGGFTSGHWQEPNIIAHYRTQELETTDGRKVLNGDEFQSDWGQRIREQGTVDEGKVERLKAELKQLRDDYKLIAVAGDRLFDKYRSMIDDRLLLNTSRITLEQYEAQRSAGSDKVNRSIRLGALAVLRPYAQPSGDRSVASNEIDAWIKLAEPAGDNINLRQAELRQAQNEGVQSHPLVRSTDQWLTTILRKFIKDAVDAGVDGVTITPGQVQADRYNLGQSGITALRYSPESQGLQYRHQQRPGWNFAADVTLEELPNYTGREVAERLLAQPLRDPDANGIRFHQLDNLDNIEIGGEGMRATYDVMYPRALGKLLQKMDKSIKPEKVRLLPSYDVGDPSYRDDRFREVSDNFQHDFTFFPITDKVRQQVQEQGQPLFALGDSSGRRTQPARDRSRRDQGGSLAPLEGAPKIVGATGPDPRVVAVAEQYARDNNIPLKRQAEYAKINPDLAARIAAAYDQMPHAPTDPKVAAAYQDMIDQTKAQYQALADAGYKFWFYDESNDPYQGNPWNAIRDLRQNQSMAVFATEAGFGSGATDVDTSTSPLLVDSGVQWPYGAPNGPLKRVLVNDMFRAVHDVFGHSMEGAGFRAQGEENAWQAHIRLYTGLAQGAMTSETRGQNSWLNFGPYGENNRTASVEDTIFGDQKSGLMPEWTWAEGRVGDREEPLFALGPGIPADTDIDFSPDGPESGSVERGAAKLNYYKTSNPNEIFMGALSVRYGERGKGNARRLLQEFTAAADAANKSIRIMAGDQDGDVGFENLLRFYRSVGFKEVGDAIPALKRHRVPKHIEMERPAPQPVPFTETYSLDDITNLYGYGIPYAVMARQFPKIANLIAAAHRRINNRNSALPLYALGEDPQTAIASMQLGAAVLEAWQQGLPADGPGPEAGVAAVSAMVASGQRSLGAMRQALADAGFRDLPDDMVEQALLAVSLLGAPQVPESVDPLYAIASFPLSGNQGRMTVLQRQQSDIVNQIDTLRDDIKNLIGGKANALSSQEEAAYRELADQVDGLHERLSAVEQELNDLYDQQNTARKESGLFEKRAELMNQVRQARYDQTDRETEIAELEQALAANPNDFQTRRQLQLARQRLADVTARHDQAQAELDKIQDDLSNVMFALRGFYSPAIRAVEQAKQDKATPDQWKKVLQGPGVRQEEVRWLGVMDWLDEQASMMVDRPGSNLPKSEKTIAKSDLLDFLRAHQYELEQRILLSERDPDDIPEDEREDEDDEPYEGMSEEERDEWIRDRADEIYERLQSEAIQQHVSDWRSENDPDDYEIEIGFEEYDTGDEQWLLEVERVYTAERQLYDQRLADVLMDDGSQLVLPGVEPPPLIAPTFEAVAERILPEEILENWRDGNVGWTAQLTHHYRRDDEDVNDGDPFPTREEAQAAAQARLDEIAENFEQEEREEWDSYADNYDFAYEYDQATQEATQDFEHEHGEDAVSQSSNYFSDQTKYKGYAIEGGRHYQEMIIRLPMLEGKYTSHHFKDQEVVHIRYDVRTGPNGEKILFIHEIQSDLHQRARAFGFGAAGLERAKKAHEDNGWTPELREAQNAADLRLSQAREEFFDLESQNLPQTHALVQTALNEVRDAEAKASEITKRAQANREAASTYISTFSRFGGAPEAPYTGTAWWELGFKAALQRAVEKGFDGVALTTPAQIREATYTPEAVAQKFYGENVPRFIDKYVKQWGAKPERKALSGVGTESRIGLRDNYTKNDFIAWLNGSKNLAARNTQDLGLTEPGWTTTEADKLLTAVTSPQFDGDLLALINASSPAMKTTASHDIPSLWRAPDGKWYLAPREGWTHYPSVPSPLVTRQLPIQNLTWPITDAMRKDLSGEGTGQPLAISESQVVRGAHGILASGRAVSIGENVRDAIFNAIEPHKAVVPSGVQVGYLSRVEPIKGMPGRVNAYFTLEDGSTHVMEYDRDGLFSLRAFFQPPNGALPPGIFFLRTTTQGEIQRGIIGEMRHEAIHALRRMGLIPEAVWSALVAHARKLQVMDLSFADYLGAVGRPTQDLRTHAVSVGDQYRSYYSGRSDFQEVFEQESVAHMAELYSHDAWDTDEIAPIKAILDDIFAGKYSGASPEGGPGAGVSTSAEMLQALRPVDREGQPIKDDPKFQAWFKDSPVVDENGDPKPVYHVTLADFPAFDPSRRDPRSNMGAGFYFTDQPHDAGTNYVETGPDVRNRIYELAYRIQDSDEFADVIEKTEASRAAGDVELDYDDYTPIAVEMAKERLGYVHEGVTLPVYLSMQKPVFFSERGSGLPSTFLSLEEEYNEELDEYSEPTGEFVEFVQTLQDVLDDYEDAKPDEVGQDLYQAALDNGGLSAQAIYTLLSNNEDYYYASDPETGELAGMEPLRRTFDLMGYDGIIDHTVSRKWPTMTGIEEATHYIVFKPEQIKSVFNAGGFDPDNPDILAAIGGSGKPNARVSKGREILDTLKNGQQVTLDPSLGQTVLDAIAPARAIVPVEYTILNLRGLAPVAAEPNQAIYTFVTDKGDTVRQKLPLQYLNTASAFHAIFSELPDRPAIRGIGFIHFAPESGGEQYFRGKVRHEGIHALRTSDRIPEAIWVRLLNHAKTLGVMDHSLGSYFEAIGEPSSNPKAYEQSLLSAYHELYKNNSRFYQDYIDQEHVAHLAELYEHGVFTPQEIAPIRHLLDALFRGEFSRLAPTETRTRQIAAPQYQVPEPIAQRLKEIANATQPSRPDPRQPSVAQAGVGAPPGLSPAARITPSRDDFARSSFIGEALGRRRIDEILRQQAVRNYLGGWWQQEAALKRAKLQGFTVQAWHSTRADFLVPNPNIAGRDFGFHVAINRPNAANERSGFSQEDIDKQLPNENPGMLGKLSQWLSDSFWDYRRNARNLPLLVKVRKPLRVPDLNYWASMPQWRAAIKDILAGRLPNIGPETHPVFRDIDNAIVSIMTEQALGKRGFDADQTFRQILVNILDTHGYDSLIYQNDYEDQGNDSLFLWDATRIRSAFDAFDPRANGNPGLYASVPFMEADLRQELNQALREEGLAELLPQFALAEDVTSVQRSDTRPMTELYTQYLKTAQKSGQKPLSFKEFAQR